MKDVMIHRSDKGEIAIFDRRDDFIASCKGGKWAARNIFQLDEWEEFTQLQDDREITLILSEARKALDKPLPDQ